MKTPEEGDMKNPSLCLVGKKLPNGWKVEKLIEPEEGASGGNYSYQYVVISEKTGQRAFLKALDVWSVFKADDFTLPLERLTRRYNFERDLLQICQKRGMDRVVRAIESGWFQVFEDNPVSKVPFLIFEKADSDVRGFLSDKAERNLAWRLRSLHHIATGLKQLHGVEIAHQDLKPSNVLVFQASTSKLADLGHATKKDLIGPGDEWTCAGDPSYAPPEGLYRHVEPDWNYRRIGCDLYLLGSMLSFFFLDVSALGLLFDHLPPDLYPERWAGSYQDVMPALRNAFNETIGEFDSAGLPKPVKDELKSIYTQLCDPDPKLRGDRSRPMNKLSLERYLTRLDVLAKRAEAGMYRGAPILVSNA
jgi:serine/threonine protein kinase